MHLDIKFFTAVVIAILLFPQFAGAQNNNTTGSQNNTSGTRTTFTPNTNSLWNNLQQGEPTQNITNTSGGFSSYGQAVSDSCPAGSQYAGESNGPRCRIPRADGTFTNETYTPTEAATAIQQEEAGRQETKEALAKNKSFCDGGLTMCVVGLVYWIGPGLAGWFASMAATILDITVRLSLNSAAYALDFLGTGWTVARDLTNLAFLFILIYIAIVIILQAETGNTMRMLATLVIMAILVNFSFFFVRVVVDAGNILAVQFYNILITSNTITSDGKTIAATSGAVAGAKSEVPDITAPLMAMVGVQQALGSKSFDTVQKTINSTSDSLAVIITMSVLFLSIAIIFWMLMFVFLQVAVKFLLRTIGLWFVIMGAPFAFAARVLTQTSSSARDLFQKWLHALVEWSFYPAVFLLLYLAIVKIATGIGGGTGGLIESTFTELGNNNTALAAAGAQNSFLGLLVSIFIKAIILVLLFYYGLRFADIFSKGGTQFANAAVGKMTGFAMSTAGIVGRQSLGRYGARIVRNNDNPEGRGSAVGRTLLRTGDWMQNRTYDARNSTKVKTGLGLVDVNPGAGTSNTFKRSKAKWDKWNPKENSQKKPEQQQPEQQAPQPATSQAAPNVSPTLEGEYIPNTSKARRPDSAKKPEIIDAEIVKETPRPRPEEKSSPVDARTTIDTNTNRLTAGLGAQVKQFTYYGHNTPEGTPPIATFSFTPNAKGAAAIEEARRLTDKTKENATETKEVAATAPNIQPAAAEPASSQPAPQPATSSTTESEPLRTQPIASIPESKASDSGAQRTSRDDDALEGVVVSKVVESAEPSPEVAPQTGGVAPMRPLQTAQPKITEGRAPVHITTTSKNVANIIEAQKEEQQKAKDSALRTAPNDIVADEKGDAVRTTPTAESLHAAVEEVHQEVRGVGTTLGNKITGLGRQLENLKRNVDSQGEVSKQRAFESSSATQNVKKAVTEMNAKVTPQLTSIEGNKKPPAADQSAQFAQQRQQAQQAVQKKVDDLNNQPPRSEPNSGTMAA